MALIDKPRVVVDVTETDIQEGVRGSSHYCIVATALGRAVPAALRIRVDAKEIAFTLRGWRLTYRSPKEVAEYVRAFDAGYFSRIKPMTLVLENPSIGKKHSGSHGSLRAHRGGKPRPQQQDRIYGLRISTRDQLDVCPKCRNYKKPVKDACCAICTSGRGERVPIGVLAQP